VPPTVGDPHRAHSGSCSHLAVRLEGAVHRREAVVGDDLARPEVTGRSIGDGRSYRMSIDAVAYQISGSEPMVRSSRA
jgi:hypothetical protein